MTQKQKQRSKDSTVDKISEGVSQTVENKTNTSSRVSGKGLTSRLYSAISKEAKAGEVATAGVVTFFAGLLVSGLLPTTVLPMIIGFAVGGAALGKIVPDNIFSVMAGVGISAFASFLLFVSAPIFGLGIPMAILLGLIATGLATAAHQITSDESI